jgi:hypothetical protein
MRAPPPKKDVIKQLKSVISYSDARLTMEERNLLSIAYKHVTGTLRTSWRTVEAIEKQEAASGSAMPRELVLIRRQRAKIELELADACQDLINLLDRHLVPAAEAGEERVFYHKMCVSFRLKKALSYLACFSQAGRLPPVPRRVRTPAAARALSPARARGLQGVV